MQQAADIAALWTRLEAWATENAPAMLEDLNGPASDADIASVQAHTGLTVPDALKAGLKIHDGESDGWPCKVFADHGAWLSCAQMREHWSMRAELADELDLEFSEEDIAEQIRDNVISVGGPVQPKPYCREWLPVMDCNGDVFWALDFAPAAGGLSGQMIRVDLEGCDWRVVAPSFREFLSAYVQSLEGGKFSIHDGLPTSSANAQVHRQVRAVDAAVVSSPGRKDLARLNAGEVVEVVAFRAGVGHDGREKVWLKDGAQMLRGTLGKAGDNQALRIKLRIGNRRWFGLRSGEHEIVSYEVISGG